MPADLLDTAQLHAWLECLRAGDPAGADGLLRATAGRLERLARHMLHGFPAVRRWADTGDVLQNALLRLLRALEATRPATTRDFFNLAAVQIRRELLDLARYFGGPHGFAAHHTDGPPGVLDAAPAVADDSADLERWQAFHDAVARLPEREREVFGLAFYHGWTHGRIAELLGVTDRQVRRRWQSACLALAAALGGRLPNAENAPSDVRFERPNPLILSERPGGPRWPTKPD